MENIDLYPTTFLLLSLQSPFEFLWTTIIFWSFLTLLFVFNAFFLIFPRSYKAITVEEGFLNKTSCVEKGRKK